MWQVLLSSSLFASLALAFAQAGGPQFAGPGVKQEPPPACKPFFSILDNCPPPPSILSMLATMTAPPTTSMEYDPAAETYQASCVCYDEKNSFRPNYISSIVMDCANFISKNGGGAVEENKEFITRDATFCSRLGDVRDPNATGKTDADGAKITDPATNNNADGGNADSDASKAAETGAGANSGSSLQVQCSLYIAVIGVLSMIMVL